ncbi:MAG: serine hydrolase [Candidatus Hodarchaeales archaeon]|jgi:CubicO group peptidase (beta-lactamase class C family)
MKILPNQYIQVIDELTSHIKGLLNSREDILGLSIALTTDKEIIWAQGFGFTDHTRKKRVTPETLFSSQSMGKCFTATTFLILASKGLVNLDDPIRKYYPEFTINTIYGNPEEEIARITFRRMLNHRAGLTHEALVGNNYDYTSCSFEEHIESIGDGWLRSPVGSEMSYSNLGYDLTGFIMGLIRNKSFKEIMEEELFQPLGIINATFEKEEALKQSFAKGYDGRFAYPVVQVPMLGAGGLFLCVLDVAKLIAFHLRKGKINHKQLISPNLLEEMYKRQFREAKEFGYGIGLYSVEKIGNAKAYGHAGGGYGYQTNMLWLPEYGIGVVVLSNNMKKSPVGGIAQKALQLMVDNLDKPEAKPISSKLLKRLEGTYCANGNLAPQLLRISYENEKLFVYFMNGTRIELFPQSATEFLTKNRTKYAFELGKEDQPIAIDIDHAFFPYRAKYNDGPNDSLGPNQKEWKGYSGIYAYEEESRPSYLALSVINGFLYLIFQDTLRLQHHENNIYFTADGETLIVGQGELNYRGIYAKKIDVDIEQFFESFLQKPTAFDYDYLAVMSLVKILNTLEGFKQAVDFLEKIVQIDKEFLENFTNFGQHLFAVGKVQEAEVCFTKLLEIDAENREANEMMKQIERIRK